MARQLRQITSALSSYLHSRFERAFHWPEKANEGELPPYLELAFLRGEALLRQRFFDYFERRHFQDAVSQLTFWRQFGGNPEGLRRMIAQSGLLEVFQKQAGEGYLSRTSQEEQCHVAYCCLLWDIHQQGDKQLLELATNRLFGHFAATLFPAEIRRDDPIQIKRDIRKQLALRWHIRPEIRESFKTTDSSVTLSLLAIMPGYHPYRLLTMEGKRLKPTRLMLYRKVLEYLEAGTLHLDPPKPRAARKDQPARPIGCV